MAYHQRALLQYKSTIGNNHHRTADLCVKVAGHYIRVGQFEAAMLVQPPPLKLSWNVDHLIRARRTLLNQALKVYGDRAIYKPEKARAKFKRMLLLMSMQKLDEVTAEREESSKLYREVCPGDSRRPEDLTDDDYDDIIVFWSK